MSHCNKNKSWVAGIANKVAPVHGLQAAAYCITVLLLARSLMMTCVRADHCAQDLDCLQLTALSSCMHHACTQPCSSISFQLTIILEILVSMGRGGWGA